jgi:endonuclease YncB( thermonuclease family)
VHVRLFSINTLPFSRIKIMDICEMSDLQALTYDLCKQFLALAEGERVKVGKVYDGDTVTVAFLRNGSPVKIQCRLEGLDTPELHSSDVREKALAMKARDALTGFALNKIPP